MKRRGIETEKMMDLRRAYKTIYRKGFTIKQALENLEQMVNDCPEVQMFIDFIQGSQRGIIR